MSVLALAVAGILAPANAATPPAAPTAFAHKHKTGKHGPGKHCSRRAKKARRGCAPQGGRHHQIGAPLPGAAGNTPAATHTPSGDDRTPTSEGDESEDGEGAEVEGESEAEAEEEFEEGESEEEAEGEEETTAGEEGPEPAAASLTTTTSRLRWAPPTLVEPKTITLGTGYTHTILPTNRDYIIQLPPTKKIGGTWIDGGHNVVVIGGYITVPQGSSSASDNETTALSIKGATGTVHVEGVLIDGSGGGEFDGVTINAPEATVQLENLRIVGVRGGYEKVHADVVQPWGGVKDLRIDRLTGRSNYQGLTLKPDLGTIGSAEVEEVDVTATTEGTVDRGGHMLWLTRGVNTCSTYPITLSNVFVTPRPGKPLSGSVWPQKNFTAGCPASGTKSLLGWPALPVAGDVQLGPPSTGNYVPSGVAGLSYLSPGYR